MPEETTAPERLDDQQFDPEYQPYFLSLCREGLPVDWATRAAKDYQNVTIPVADIRTMAEKIHRGMEPDERAEYTPVQVFVATRNWLREAMETLQADAVYFAFNRFALADFERHAREARRAHPAPAPPETQDPQ